MRAGIAVIALAACGGGGGPSDDPDAAGGVDGAWFDSVLPAASNRDRLLATYLTFLRTRDAPQSNGLFGADLADVCELWTRLDPSSRATFLTLTARMDGALLVDRSSLLDHATGLYRVVGGDGATATDPGSCGGGEYNRMIVAIDEPARAALIAANVHQGAPDGAGHRDLEDILPGGFWRDSHDAAGPHAPFDLSDESDDGAPRGQLQLFTDPATAPATEPLGRLDLADVVEPNALEIDHDFDCFHNSNPTCSYTLYGPACAPMANLPGTEIYAATYGDFDPAWTPDGC